MRRSGLSRRRHQAGRRGAVVGAGREVTVHQLFDGQGKCCTWLGELTKVTGRRACWLKGAKRRILNLGAARGGLRRPRRASKLLRIHSGVRRRGRSLRTVHGGRWGGVVKRGSRYSCSPAAARAAPLWSSKSRRWSRWWASTRRRRSSDGHSPRTWPRKRPRPQTLARRMCHSLTVTVAVAVTVGL